MVIRWSLVPHEGQSGYRVPLNGLWVVVWCADNSCADNSSSAGARTSSTQFGF